MATLSAESHRRRRFAQRRDQALQPVLGLVGICVSGEDRDERAARLANAEVERMPEGEVLRTQAHDARAA